MGVQRNFFRAKQKAPPSLRCAPIFAAGRNSQGLNSSADADALKIDVNMRGQLPLASSWRSQGQSQAAIVRAMAAALESPLISHLATVAHFTSA